MKEQLQKALPESDMGQMVSELVGGLSALSGEYAAFHDGLSQYAGGVSTLAGEYGKLHTGIASLYDGMKSLENGASSLYTGTDALDAEAAKIPDQIELEVDDLLGDYDTSDFKPVSFVSAKNGAVSAVQFVIKTEPVKMAEDQQETDEEPERQDTIWDRFLALFHKKGAQSAGKDGRL
jgi:X-X-X-Leu-X-X-Gly heptad repeat protein